MTAISEQGHNRNVANFEKMIINCTSYGTAFNPSKTTLKVAALQTLSVAARNSITAVNSLTPAYKNAVAARMTGFKTLDKLATRILNAIKVSDTTPEVIENAKAIIRKIQGIRTTPKKSDEEKKLASDAGTPIIEISTSQRSYDNRLDNFDKLIKLLGSIAQYTPNEADLKITALTALYTDLKSKNNAVATTETPLYNARVSRNDILYKNKTGLVDVANDVKIYIKSVFGATSPQYKQNSKLIFKSVEI